MQQWIPIVINLAVYIVSFAVGWGKLTAKIAEIEGKYRDLNKEVESLRESRVHTGQCKSQMSAVECQLRDIKAINIDSRLTRIETLLGTVNENIKELKERKS